MNFTRSTARIVTLLLSTLSILVLVLLNSNAQAKNALAQNNTPEAAAETLLYDHFTNSTTSHQKWNFSFYHDYGEGGYSIDNSELRIIAGAYGYSKAESKMSFTQENEEMVFEARLRYEDVFNSTVIFGFDTVGFRRDIWDFLHVYSGSEKSDTISSVDSREWHNYRITLDGQRAKFFVDGNKIGDLPQQGTAMGNAILSMDNLGGSWEAILVDWVEVSVTPQVSPPAPDLVSASIPSQANVNEPFLVTIKADNIGATSQEGAINASVLYKDGTDNVVIDQVSAPWANLYKRNYAPGDGPLYNKSCQVISGGAKDHVVETAENNWTNGERHTLSFRVKPQKAGTLWVRVRTTMKGSAGSCDYYNDRSIANGVLELDQQNWAVKRIAVTVVEPTPDPPPKLTLNDISNSDKDGNYKVSWSSSSIADSYELQEKKGSGSWKSIYNGSVTSSNISGKSDATYCYQVRGLNEGVPGPWSDSKCTTVDTTPSPPNAPTLADIDNGDQDGSYAVGWSNVTNADDYELQEKIGSNNWDSTPIYEGSGTSTNINGKTDGTYCYRVRGLNQGVPGSWSETKCATVDLTPAPPGTPALAGINNSDKDGSFTVSWPAISGAASYELEENKDGGSWKSIYTGSATNTNRNYLATGTWCYQARASNSGGTSSWSESKCTVVDIPPPCYTLTIAIAPLTGGTVAANKAANCSDGKYRAGTELSLIAKPLDGYRFDRWSGDLSGSTSPTSLVINKNFNMTGHFDEQSKTNLVNYVPLTLSSHSFFTDFSSPDEQEPNDIYAQANGSLIFGETYHGQFGDSSDVDDYFYFLAPEPGTFVVRLFSIPAGQDYDLILLNLDRELAGYSAENGNDDEFIFEKLPSGVYFIQVYNPSQKTSQEKYSLQVFDAAPSFLAQELFQDVTTGQNISMRFDVPSPLRTMIAWTEWDQGSLQSVLIDPNGRLITPQVAAADPKITYRNETNFDSYQIDQPHPGEWNIQANAKNMSGGNILISAFSTP